jgi:predicted Fe-Mo cluster-binding NifX family protein
MIVAIPAAGSTPAAAVDPRFGRAQGFMLYNSETDNYHYIENSQNLNAVQGAGIQAAQHIAAHKAGVLLCGNVGPKAYALLQKAGITLFSCRSETVEQAITDWKANALSPIDNATVEGHWV